MTTASNYPVTRTTAETLHMVTVRNPPPQRDTAVFRRNTAVVWAEAINLYTAWMKASNLAPGTIRQRRWHLRHLAETHIDRSPFKLKADDLVLYLSTKSWGADALKNCRTSLRTFYAWAHQTEKIRRNPAADLPTITVPAGHPRPAPVNVLEHALADADDRVRLMLLLASMAGLRCCEISSLTWDNVEPRRLIVRGKGGKVRGVPINGRLSPELQAEHAHRLAGTTGTGYRWTLNADVYVFPSQGGESITAGSVSRIMSRHLGRFTGHQLRHLFSARAYAGQRDLRAVSTLMGHANVQTTVRYTPIPDGALLAAVEAAAGDWKGKP